METDAGLAEIAVKSTQRVNIGFETEYKEKGMPVKTKKVWILNVQVSPPNESLTQNQDDITESTYDYNYTGYGVNLKDSAGSEDYVDENGNTVRIYTATALPDDDNYDTFLDSVPTPKAKTA